MAAPGAALAQKPAQKTVEDHRHDDVSAPKTPAQERALTRKTQAATADDAQAAALATAGAPEDVGTWSAPVDWPVVGVHVALLPNGKVLAYDSIGDQATEAYAVHDHTRATVWDPATGAHTDVRVDTGFNVFCSGLAHLLDGSVFLAGGNKDAHLSGIRQTHIFNHQTNAWSLGADMAYERWYPTVTGLGNGEMLITDGGPDIPEVRQRDGSLRTLSTASRNLPMYPWIDVAPDGRAFYSGPDQTMRALNPDGTGAWQDYTQRDSIDRDYGGHAMYGVGKILVAGGGSSVKDARVIDLNGASPTVSQTAPMAFGRRQNNLTLLADGTALATGGNSSGASLVDMDNGVYAAELWNPATGQWKTLAAQQVTRQYHSTALLLPDGRVLSSGGGICGTCDQVGYLAKNAELFTPPYLYDKDGSGTLAPRPSVTSAPATIDYGTQFAIGTPDAAQISKVGLVRLGGVTHSVDMDQRYVPLSFTAGSGTLTATAPANQNIAPPGPYMLFVVNADGVPSVARMVTVPPFNAPPAVSITQPASGAVFDAPATINIAASATDDVSVAKVEFFNGATKLGEDLTAPYTHAWSGVAEGTYSLTARATDGGGKTTTSAPVSISVRAPNVAPSVSITSPADGAVFAYRANVTITASASDSDGRVTKVEFFRDDGARKLGEDTTAPYSHLWLLAPSGTHYLRARATDNLGAVGTSARVTIRVRGLLG
ncbi:MAG: Ig-like domain-containing protein [Actinomycetota bacterium]|nr:Ig-like domain-containing protein [Actinomycetota bacterium]